jgi:hypothetical protein
MAELLLVEQLRDYLVTQAVATMPADADPARPSIWLQPKDGAPEPRQGKEAATVTLVDSQLGGHGELEAWLEEAFIDVIIVAPLAATCKLLHRGIRNLIHPIGSHGGRSQWMMGLLLVEYSTVWRAEQPLGQTDSFYARTASYRFCCRRKALAGTPDLP